MILSMTGYGRAIVSTTRHKITAEVKSLNSKQLDLFLRVPSTFRELEVEARNLLGSILERGKAEASVSVESISEESHLTLNPATLASYKKQISDVGMELGLAQPRDWYDLLLHLPEIWQSNAEELGEEEKEAFMSSIRLAAEALTEFRIQEGRKLYLFFREKIDNIRRLLLEVEPYENSRVQKIRQRLEDQLASLHGVDYDKGRLEQELIFYIEKFDVSEEKLRLRSHLDYFLETLGPEGDGRPAAGQGKKLGFIAQEMGREINTLGSKSNNAEMQIIVVKMKDELEQIKEQVLNVL